MSEIYNLYNHQIYEKLKEKVKGYVVVKTNAYQGSLYITISDFNIVRFCYFVGDLDSYILNGTWNADEITNQIVDKYKRYILNHYIN